MSRKSHTRGKDDAREMDEEFQCASRLWGRMRRRVPAKVREYVDIVAELGGMSLHDIELLEVTAHRSLEERIKRLEKRPKSTTAIASCLSLQVQSRKHMRTLRLAMSPIGTPNDQRHPEPEQAAKRRAAHEKLAAAEANPEAKTDLGDELVN